MAEDRHDWPADVFECMWVLWRSGMPTPAIAARLNAQFAPSEPYTTRQVVARARRAGETSTPAWPPEAISYLRMRWADGATQAVIGGELRAMFGNPICFTRVTVARQAVALGLGSHRLDIAGKDGAEIIRLRAEGKSNQQIADALGCSLESAIYRIRKLIEYGMLDPLPQSMTSDARIAVWAAIKANKLSH